MIANQRNKFLADSAINIAPTSGATQSSSPAIAKRKQGDLRGFLLATATVVTVPFRYFTPGDEATRSLSISAPIVWEMRQKRGRRVSLREARTLALTIGATIESRMEKYKSEEASFWSWLYSNET